MLVEVEQTVEGERMTDCLPRRKRHYYGMERWLSNDGIEGLRTPPTECCIWCGKAHPKGPPNVRYRKQKRAFLVLAGVLKPEDISQDMHKGKSE